MASNLVTERVDFGFSDMLIGLSGATEKLTNGSVTSEKLASNLNLDIVHVNNLSSNNFSVTGSVTTPTIGAGDNSTNIATTAWVAQASCLVHTTGNETVNGTKTFTSVIQGTALNAQWADVAEKYESDAPYEAGTLVMFGGEKEITVAHNNHVNGVVSTNPAIRLNSKAEGLYLALTGRVPVLVSGPISKFDKIVLDENMMGIARKKTEQDTAKTIGIALHSDDAEDIRLVECVVQLSLD